MADDASTQKQSEGDNDELRRRFREALAHKQAGGPHGNGGHPGSKNPAPSSNDKRQRTFRRKSG